MKTKSKKELVSAVLALFILLMTIPFSMLATDTSAAEASGKTYTLDAGKDLTAFAAGAKKDGETEKAGTDDYFTLIYSAKAKVEDNTKEFSDYTGTKRINFGGRATIEKNSIMFETKAPATVKVWWVSGGNKVTILDANENAVVTTNESVAKNAVAPVANLELKKAGTYYLGGDVGNNYIFKVVVTEDVEITDSDVSNSEDSDSEDSEDSADSEPDDSNSGDSNTGDDSNTSDSKPSDSKPADSESSDSKPADSESSDSKPADSESSDSKPADSESSDSKPADSESSESKPSADKDTSDSESSDSKPADSESSESKPADSESSDSKPADSKPSADKEPADSESSDSKPADSESSDSKPADSESSDSKPADSESSDSKPSADKEPSDSKPADSESSDSKPSADKEPSDSKPADSKPADESKPADSSTTTTESEVYKNETNNVEVSVPKTLADSTLKDATLAVEPVKNTDTNDKTVTYDISFKDKDGKTVSLDKNTTEITVQIPVPETLKGEDKLYVYYVDDNGKYTNMNATVKGDSIEFKTTHFSKYLITTDGSLESTNKEDNADTGFGGIAMAVGIVALAGAAIVVAKKRR